MARCRACGNTQVNRHHLIPKEDRKPGPQLTVKLCKDQNGCRVHHRFHIGDRKAARTIRLHLKKKEYFWLVNVMGQEWTERTYPRI
jgi:histidinol phosphatase-like enzyme